MAHRTSRIVGTFAALIVLAGCFPDAKPSPQEPPAATQTATEAPGQPPAEVAKDALTAYCNTELSQAQWWDELSPYLTDRGVALYRNSSLARVSDCTVGDVETPGEEDGSLRQYYRVNTDEGQWLVTVARLAHTQWKVDSFTPPPTPDATQPQHTDESEPDF